MVVIRPCSGGTMSELRWFWWYCVGVIVLSPCFRGTESGLWCYGATGRAAPEAQRPHRALPGKMPVIADRCCCAMSGTKPIVWRCDVGTDVVCPLPLSLPPSPPSLSPPHTSRSVPCCPPSLLSSVPPLLSALALPLRHLTLRARAGGGAEAAAARAPRDGCPLAAAPGTQTTKTYLKTDLQAYLHAAQPHSRTARSLEALYQKCTLSFI
eukprot:2276489-Rhodomonas_salina.1